MASSSAAPLSMDQGTASWGKDAAANDESLQLPSIFLSHSGRQKAGFVTHLYHALRHVNHRPFFDKDPIDSLPPGLDYPCRIFQACKAAKMGVIVLSEDYVTSLWPMLELQHLILPYNPDRLIYPLFYELRPADLAIPANLLRWEEYWAKEAEKWHCRMLELQAFMSSSGCDIQINLDLSSWSEMLKKLQYRSGEVQYFIDANNERTPYQSDHDFIQAIVSNICVSLPPPRKFSLGNSMKGTQRMAKEIAEAFKQEVSLGADGVRAMGVHGIGGSGKTTLCKMMANFFSNEFCGRCFYIEFPSNNNEVQSLLQNIKAILRPPASVGASSTHDVSDLDEAMGLLEVELRRNKLFLAIDNVWGHLQSERQIGLDYAKRIMQMKFMAGSKILVTSRSGQVLTRLLQSRLAMTMVGNLTSRECPLPHPTQPYKIMHVPSLTEAEAVEALKSYCCFSCFIPEDHLQSLAHSCFFQGQCHPLYLNLKGSELERKGTASFNGQKWKETISSLVSNGGNPGDSSEDAVFRAVEMSLNVLPSHLQDIFIILVSWPGEENWEFLKYLRFHLNDGTEDALFDQVLELEYHGLLEVRLDATDSLTIADRLVIHDLHRDAAMKRLKSRPQANSLADHDVVTYENLSGFSCLDLASKKLVHGECLNVNTLSTLFGSRNVFGSWLRTLGTNCFECFEWAVVRTPAQVQVQIQVLLVEQTLGSAFYPWQLYSIRSLNFGRGSMEALRVLRLSSISEIREINGWEGVPNLMWLYLKNLDSLGRIEPLGCLKWLETVHLRLMRQS